MAATSRLNEYYFYFFFINMRHIQSLIHNVFYEICGRSPTPHELDMYSKFLRSYPSGNYQLYESVFKIHLAKQANRFKIFHPDPTISECSEKDLSDTSILVVGLVRNISPNIKYVKDLIYDLKKAFKKVCFFFYHNNSTDNSVSLLKQWMSEDSDVSGVFADSTSITVIDSETHTIGNRIPMFARMRNENISAAIKHFGKEFDVLLMSNTDLVDKVDIQGITKSLSLQEPWSIICGNCCFQNSYFHYDAYALRLLQDPIDVRELYPDFDRYYGWSTLWMDKFHVFDGWTKVRSGFGDMCLINMSTLLELHDKLAGEICKVDDSNPHTCELISMCDTIGGNVWISPYLVYPATMKLETEPCCFIPRDAGFFSVFNFFLGALIAGQRLYPYYNKKAFQDVHKENKHFCYWSGRDNSWFDYFEPVSFFKGDNIHEGYEYTKYRISHGEAAGGEFRNPIVYGKMMNSPELWKPWRKMVNSVVRKYIHIKEHIIDAVDDFWVINNLGNNVIGVHYRHPSHYVESGKVFLRDYFEKIDTILLEHPAAKIFLATDNELGLMAFSHRYNGRVTYIPEVTRVEVDNILEWAHEKKGDIMDFVDGRGYQLHYTLCGSERGSKAGEDILKEVLCLSKCKWFVHVISNVALAVSYFNPDLDMHTVLSK